MDKSSNISIIIITYKREILVENLLNQIKLLSPLAEVILVNNNDDETLNPTKFSLLTSHLIHQKFQTPAMARNEAIKYATREWLVFFDDDIILPNHYFSTAQDLLQSHSNIDILGGPDQTPIDSGYFQTALGYTLQSPMATAHTRLRHLQGPKKDGSASERDLILCHLWIRKSFLDRNHLRFPNNFFRNEENLLIHFAKKLNAHISYDSKLFVYHYRKSYLPALFFAVFRSGFYRIKSFREAFSIAGILFIIPSLWIIFLCYSLFQIISYNDLNLLSKSLLALYAFLSLLTTALITIKKPQYFIVALFYQFFLNFVYGLGTIAAITRLLLRLSR